MAYPGRQFRGRVSKVYAAVDPVTHRLTIRSEVADPGHELRPGMLATFLIHVGAPETSPAVPADAVVREGDGTMTAWVTADRHRFTPRTLQLGLRQEGQVQVLAGLQPGELVVVEGGVFLSNLLQTPPSD